MREGHTSRRYRHRQGSGGEGRLLNSQQPGCEDGNLDARQGVWDGNILYTVYIPQGVWMVILILAKVVVMVI